MTEDEKTRRLFGVSPGRKWRVLAHRKTESVEIENQGMFDELVVDHWLHIEKMDKREWWMRVGDASIYVTIAKEGGVEVNIVRGKYAEVSGSTSTSTKP